MALIEIAFHIPLFLQMLLGGLSPADKETFDQENSVVELGKSEQAERRKSGGT